MSSGSGFTADGEIDPSVPWQELPAAEAPELDRSAIEAVMSGDLADQIVAMAPWHHVIRLTAAGGTTGTPFGVATARRRDSGHRVRLTDHTHAWETFVMPLFPEGLTNKRMLDVACNAGAYCFLAREAGATTFGFDIREHWIRQARLVQEHREVAPTDRMTFEVADLGQLHSLGLEPFDVTVFSGIFYHLADPIGALRQVAELTSDVIWVDTAAAPRSDDDRSLVLKFESTSAVMSGVEHLSWHPSGPRVLALMLAWMGFRDFRVVRDRDVPHAGRRIGLLAAREEGRLDDHPVGRKIRVNLPDNADS